MSSVIIYWYIYTGAKSEQIIFDVDCAGRGVGRDFGMVLAEIAAPLYEREHLTDLIREQGRGAIL
jgi:hypothetical protein